MKRLLKIVSFLIPAILFPTLAICKTQNTDIIKEATSPAIKIVLLATLITIAPSLIVSLTSFTRIVVVLSFLKQALGLQRMPPNQIIIGLSLFLTFFVMSPYLKRVDENALRPLLNDEITYDIALQEAIKPLREFMLKETREKDIALLMKFTHKKRPKNEDEVPTSVLIPAFMISELTIAFQIGFLIYIPFLVIDMVVASVLLSMGMLMLPPIMISLPFKIMLFVLMNGWDLVVGSLIATFH